MWNKIKIILLLTISLFSLFEINYTFAFSDTDNAINTASRDAWTEKNDILKDFWKDNWFIKNTWTWEDAVYYSMINIAKSIKNLFFTISILFFLIITFRLLFADKADDELGKFKKGIIWITIWLIVMQTAFVYVEILYSKEIWKELAFDLTEKMIKPFIWILEVLASVFFLWVAIYAFFRMVTANWDDAKVKEWKMSIIYALMWFVIIKTANVIVSWVYWAASCTANSVWISSSTCEIEKANLSELWTIALNIINRANWFIWIIVLIMIIYAWWKILLSKWKEETLKESKSVLIYVVIWLLLLAINYLILTIFILPENTI